VVSRASLVFGDEAEGYNLEESKSVNQNGGARGTRKMKSAVESITD
jgi:hypothetical protein